MTDAGSIVTPADPVTIDVRGEAADATGGYPVVVGNGIIATLSALVGRYAPAHRYVVISDSNVAALHGAAVAERLPGGAEPTSVLTFPAGEQHKTREQWITLSDRMLASRFGRDCAVIAVGGGVTGDLAGFVAATYMRGVPVVHVATSLLAMVDSSVGGKTGVDTAAGKNLIGAFHPPALVVADTATLATLPPPHLRSGLAEAVKHGAIVDAEYLAALEDEAGSILDGEPEALTRVVERSVRIKADVVSRDLREGGLRKILNFGHTLGHALELLSGYTLLHGEAISIGMVLEARIGERLGVTRRGSAERLERVLRRLGLPTRPSTDVDPEAVISSTLLDKKAVAGSVEYSLIEQIGRAAKPVGVAPELITEILEGIERTASSS